MLESLSLSHMPVTMAFDPYGLIIAGLGVAFCVLLWRAKKLNGLDWTDLITHPHTKKVSLTKLLQFIGGIVATWMMIHMTMKGTLTGEYFITYLTYVGAIEGWSKFVIAKYGAMAPSNNNGYRPYFGRQERTDMDDELEDQPRDNEAHSKAVLDRSERMVRSDRVAR